MPDDSPETFTTPTQVALCFDYLIPASVAAQHMNDLETAIGNMGKKVIRVEFGTTLKCNGKWFENKTQNKMVVTLAPRLDANDDVVSKPMMREFMEFFANKVVPDPVDEEVNA